MYIETETFCLHIRYTNRGKEVEGWSDLNTSPILYERSSKSDWSIYFSKF